MVRANGSGEKSGRRSGEARIFRRALPQGKESAWRRGKKGNAENSCSKARPPRLRVKVALLKEYARA
jgi:hypothetical protein